MPNANIFNLFELFSHGFMSNLNIFQNSDESQENNININDKITELKSVYKAGQIDKIKINVYQSLDYDEDQNRLIYFIVDKYFNESIRQNINASAKKFNGHIKQNIIPRDDPNNVCTYYMFPSIFELRQFLLELNLTMIQNQFKIGFLHGNHGFMNFDEKMMDSKELSTFLHYLESIPSVKHIQRNIFDSNKIATYFEVHPYEQKNVKYLLKEFLLEKNLIFDTSLYPLENDIIIKENLIFDNKSDAEAENSSSNSNLTE